MMQGCVQHNDAAPLSGFKGESIRRFDAIDLCSFDDMRDLWRAKLRRVEEILSARLKHS
jgi:hypothetical protein